MTQEQALEAAKKMNADGFQFIFGDNIRFIAQNADGEWQGFPDMPEQSRYGEEWECQSTVCLDRQWNDNWQNTLIEVDNA